MVYESCFLEWWCLNLAPRGLKQQLAGARRQIVTLSTLAEADADIANDFALQLVSKTATRHLSPKGQLALAIRRNMSNVAAKVDSAKLLVGPGCFF
jgi:hypothetical protein